MTAGCREKHPRAARRRSRSPLGGKGGSEEDAAAEKAIEDYKTYGLENMIPKLEYEGEFLTEEEFKTKTNQ